MKGLVLKELYAAKTTLKSALTSAVLFTVMAIGMKSPGYLGAALMILISTCLINSIAYDESSKWDMMLITMPVTAKQAVGAKYVSFLLFDVIGFVYSAIIYAVIEKDLPGAFIFGGSMAVAATVYVIIGARVCKIRRAKSPYDIFCRHISSDIFDCSSCKCGEGYRHINGFHIK